MSNTSDKGKSLRKPSGSLEKNVLAPVFVAALLLFAGLLAFTNHTSVRRSLELQKNEARSIAHAITYAAQTVPDLKQLNRFVASLGGHDNIESIYIIDDRRGEIVASTNFRAIGTTVSTFKTLTRNPSDQQALKLETGQFLKDSSNESLTFCDPVDLSRWDTEKLSSNYGRVVITLDRRVGNDEIRRASYLYTAAAASCVFILLVCIFALIKRQVLRPLQSIADGLDSHFKNQTPFRKPHLSDDEIGHLAEHLENTFGTILAQNEKATNLSRDLHFQKNTLDRHSIVSETDSRGRLTYVNDSFCEISGYTQEELIGKDHRVLNSRLHPMEFWKNMYRELSRKGLWRGEIRNKAKDGSFYWVSTTIAAFKNEKGSIEKIVSIRTDITALKEAEFKLLKTNSEIERSLQIAKKAKYEAEMAANAKAQFLATMSHEIRTPMNGLIGVLHLIEGKLPPDEVELMKTAKNSANDLLVLINDILDFSKIEAGRMELESIEFDGIELIESVCELHAPTAHNQQLDLSIKYDPSVQYKLRGDPVRIRQVVSNLLGNAIKFTQHGFVQVSLEVKERNYRISVTDTGIGLKEDSQEDIFDSFTQENSSTTRKFGGSGLGLSICKKLVGLMGGHIFVESEQGSGSTFSFEIPRAGPAVANEQEERARALRGKTALLIQPDFHVKSYLEKQFSYYGIDAYAWTGEPENLHTFDFVILDAQHATQIERTWNSLKSSIRLAADYKLILLNSVGSNATETKLEESHLVLTKPANRRKLLDALTTRQVQAANPAGVDSEDKTYSKLKILIVDDNITNRLIATRILKQRHGIPAETATSGGEAIQKIRSQRFDIVFMDCMMPEMDGYTATRKIRSGEAGQEAVDTPVIAFTANVMSGDREECNRAGMDDYLSKPINPKDIARVLEDWGSGRRRSQPQEKSSSQSLLDLEKLHKIFRGDRAAIETTLDLFEESILENIQQLDSALHSRETDEDIRFYAHRIRGSAAEVGASELTKATLEMEEHCIENRLDEAAKSYQAVAEAVAEVLHAVSDYRRGI